MNLSGIDSPPPDLPRRIPPPPPPPPPRRSFSRAIIHLADELRSVSSIGGARSRSRSRIYGPRNLEDNFHLDFKKNEIQPVVAKIDRIYSLVDLDEGALGSGYCCCLGLLDPIANIHANFYMYDAAAAPPGKGAGNMAQRSLDGLIAFLTCLFPYLPDAEALAYLDAANVDPLVAARLIVRRREMGGFDYHSATTVAAVETALRSAAVAAQHPDPQGFVRGWKSLSAGSSELLAKLSVASPDHKVVSGAVRLIQTPKPDLELQELWELAKRRRDCIRPIGKELPPARAAMKRMLLAKIHRFYLKALGSLPKDELTNRYHHSMLCGGSCYGPLDPVSNIIVNTIWYDQTFPASKIVELTMISTEGLWRAAARSLFGLVSFLCTRYPRLTPDQALRRLLEKEANLEDADPFLFGTPKRDNKKLNWSGSLQIGSGKPEALHKQRSALEETQPSVSVSEAYAAAATAAFHPCPLAQKEFLGSSTSVFKLQAAKEMLHLDDGCELSKVHFELLRTHISRSPSSVGMSDKQPEPGPTKVSKQLYAHISECSDMFWGQHRRVSSMVATALSKFNKAVDPPYRLHIIVGVNEWVSGPEFSLDPEVTDYNPWTPYKYEHSHINFLATRGKDAATLFFAECSKDGTSAWCAPVIEPPQDAGTNPDTGVNPDAATGSGTSVNPDAATGPGTSANPDAATDPNAEQVRCIYCEHQRNRIVHPSATSFHGRGSFVELYYGPEKDYSNDKAIITKSVDWVDGVEDDAIHLNYTPGDDDSDEEKWPSFDIC